MFLIIRYSYLFFASYLEAHVRSYLNTSDENDHLIGVIIPVSSVQIFFPCNKHLGEVSRLGGGAPGDPAIILFLSNVLFRAGRMEGIEQAKSC